MKGVDLCRSMCEYLPTCTHGSLRVEVSIGTTRIDIVNVGEDYLEGYELKGDTDPLTSARFKKQVAAYDEVCDFCTLVIPTSDKRAAQAEQILPFHWGILAVNHEVQVVRIARENMNQTNAGLAKQLWMSQLQSLLKRHHIEKRCRRKREYAELASALDRSILRAEVIKEWLIRKVEPSNKWKPRKVNQ